MVSPLGTEKQIDKKTRNNLQSYIFLKNEKKKHNTHYVMMTTIPN